MTARMQTLLALALVSSAGIPLLAQNGTPRMVFDELVAADRAFSARGEKTDLVSGLSSLFADDVVMMVPGKAAQGKEAAIAALRKNPDNARSRVQWMPKGGGVSADGLHGFTYGFMLTHGPDGKPAPGKYLAYWVKGAEGWRVAVYKRSRAAGDTPVSPDLRPPALPPQLVPVSTDQARLSEYRESLAEAERAFSRDAQTVGLGAAFVRYGRPDAINLGGPDVPEFVIGNEEIGKLVGRGEPETGSSVSWGPDRTLVATSGDLGVTIGVIRRNAPPSDPSAPSEFPFFTIWRRDSPKDPWRYIAE
jgi:ketosteroid isomerase-like protein